MGLHESKRLNLSLTKVYENFSLPYLSSVTWAVNKCLWIFLFFVSKEHKSNLSLGQGIRLHLCTRRLRCEKSPVRQNSQSLPRPCTCSPGFVNMSKLLPRQQPRQASMLICGLIGTPEETNKWELNTEGEFPGKLAHFSIQRRQHWNEKNLIRLHGKS